MKKFLALAALVLGLASCQTEPEGFDVNVGGAVDTEITVSLPDMTTRAGVSNSATSDINAILANDYYTMRYMLQVFYGDKPSELYVRYSDNQKVSFPVRLVPGEDRDYNFVVWADIVEQVANLVDDVKCADLHYAIGTDLRDISVIPNKWVAMDETRDAFTAVKLVENYTGSQAIDIDLYRPFAKLRVITTDMVELTKHGIIPTTAVVTYKTEHRMAYNALTGEAADASATKEHSYTIAAYGDNTETDRVLFTDYFFAEDTDVVKFEMLVEEENGDDIVTRVFNTDISVKPNYLTTLKGDILTNGTDVNVTVKPDMGGNHDYEVKYVNSASGLQDAIDEILAGGSGSGSITLEGDIDLGDLFAGLLSTRATVPDYCIEIPANVDITLDLNGKNVTTSYQQGSDSKHMYAFKNNGLLTITDSSAEGNGQIIARGNFNYGTMTLESGSIVACDGNGGYGVRNYENATFVMNGGSICTSNEDGDLPGAGYDATTLRVDNGAKATINGGTINNICDFTFAIENHGTTTVKGGTITSVHSTVANYGTMTINGGSFTCNGLEGITAHALWAAAGTTTINGGTFDGKDNYNGFNVCASAGAEVNIYGGVFNPVHSGSLYGEGTINVMGGEFFDDPSARVAPGYKAELENGLYTVVELVFAENFKDNSWENIAVACQINRVPSTWNVGDKKEMTIGDSTYNIVIIGKEHDAYSDGSGNAPLTFQVSDVFGAAQMNATATNATGWTGSKMRTTTMVKILSGMPTEVQNAIKAVDKKTLKGDGSGLETTSDKLFLLSLMECYGSTFYSNGYKEGAKYNYYENEANRVMSSTWWLRGPGIHNGNNNGISFTQIIMSGLMANGDASYELGVVFGFCF